MRHIIGLVLLITTLLMGSACGHKSEPAQDQASEDEWPEMDSFHMLMAEAFHPYKDSSNLEPAKKLAGELSLEAENWQGAPLPRKVDNDVVKDLLKSLKADSQQLAELIKAGATDQEIGTSLTAVHDQFHKITEAWHGEGEKHEH